MFRIGQGYDVHRLEQGRELWLGGVLIPYPSGLSGHSDADVLLHALARRTADLLLLDGLLGHGLVGPVDGRALVGLPARLVLGRRLHVLAVHPNTIIVRVPGADLALRRLALELLALLDAE